MKTPVVRANETWIGPFETAWDAWNQKIYRPVPHWTERKVYHCDEGWYLAYEYERTERAKMSNGTVTTTHSGTLNPGPFETAEQAWDTSDIPPGLLNPPASFSVYQKITDGKWWRQFWSTTTLPPLEGK